MSRGKSKSPAKQSRWRRFLSAFVLFLVILGLAIRPVSRGALFYRNHRGEAVFVPFVLLIAAIVVVIVFIERNRK
ncbi:MAG TPA: hypothetical protein VKB48_03475 [Candidatus Acidoferrum sp.]|nr:hypothetical protein [Candidatus Acidoferrum sp.]